MASFDELEGRIIKIEERNQRVETDKAWETSWARKILIATLTYLVVVLFFYAARLPKPWLNSLVPAVAFVLSTATVPLMKSFWLKRRVNRETHR
ncbi:MAG: hypothetical protein WC497_03395 [Patescibacteria group bacterium]